jgi:hypothetical protein
MPRRKTIDFTEIIKQWHPTKNGDLKLSDFSHSKNKKAWWLCPVAEDHEWEASFSERKRKGMLSNPAS